MALQSTSEHAVSMSCRLLGHGWRFLETLLTTRTDPRVLYFEMQEREEIETKKRRLSLWRPPPVTHFKVQLMPAPNLFFFNMSWLCRESRSVFFQHYGRFMLTNVEENRAWEEVEEARLPRILGRPFTLLSPERYFDFERDTLAVSEEFFDNVQGKDGWIDLSCVENIAFSAISKLSLYDPLARLSNLTWLFDFLWLEVDNLRTVTITIGEIRPRRETDHQITLDFVGIEEGTIDLIQEKHKKSENLLVSRRSPRYTAANIQRLMESAKEVTNKIWENVDECRAEDEPTEEDLEWVDSLDFQVAFASHRLRPLTTIPERVWVVPEQPQYKNVAFYTWRPGAVGMNDKQWMDALHMGLPCDLEGSIGKPATKKGK
ncbi:hypothetical protein V8E51_002970 [Hyaloscypha variabilis]